MAADRSVADVLQDILRNVQDILRSEVRLAKAEIRQEATQAATAAVWMTIGVVGLLSAWMFLLWTAVYVLATVLPMWAATLVIAVAMAVCRGHGDQCRATQVHANQANAGADDRVAPGESRMDEAAHKIEAQIDRTRERLGSNLRELEDRIDAGYRLARAVPRATSLVPRRGDCRRCAPGGGPPPDGFAASLRLFQRGPSRDPSRATGSTAREQALELWNNIKGALIGVAARGSPHTSRSWCRDSTNTISALHRDMTCRAPHNHRCNASEGYQHG